MYYFYYYTLLFFAGSAFIYTALGALMDFSARFWPKISGEVAHYEIVKFVNKRDDNDVYFNLYVDYQYVFKGRLYSSDILNSFFHVAVRKELKLRELVEKTIIANKIDVFVFPFWPVLAYVYPGKYNKYFVFGVCFFSFIFMFIVWYEKTYIYG